jgi:signal transduction histidine kinase
VTQFARLGVASRAFSLAAILGLGLAFSNPVVLQVTLVVVVLAALAVYMSTVLPTPTAWVIAGEASFGSAIVILTLPDSVLVLPYLVVLPLLAGAGYAIFGSSLVIGGQLLTVILLTLTSGGMELLEARTELLAPWSLTIISAGLLGAWTNRSRHGQTEDKDARSYESARRLLTQLSGVTRRLSSGLDPHEIAVSMQATVREVLDLRSSTVLVMTDGGVFLPLANHGPRSLNAAMGDDPVVHRCWDEKQAQLEDRRADGGGRLALPLRVEDTMIGVLVGSGRATPSRSDLDRAQENLDRLTLRLDAALAFDEIKTAVTSDERQRLAREIHDGVAQELASLGYSIDEIVASTDDDAVATELKELRTELSRVITELRLSIFDLRSDVSQTAGLGAALSDYLQTVGSRSNITVHLTLDEAPMRLSPGVETELFRITQEAIANARKHSGAKNLWVDCQVQPPYARINVRDDGCGLGGGRDDSFGLRIMRERAERVRATLTVEAGRKTKTPGTSVTVTVR